MTGPRFESSADPASRDSQRAPGAMTRAMSAVRLAPTGERALRLGVLEDGAIRDERVHTGGVTVGTDEGATVALAIADSGVPRRFELFRRAPNGWVMRFPATARGRVASGAQAHDLAALVSEGRARDVGGVFEVALPSDSRGKIVIGKSTLLFQLVVPPPARTRPRLPASVRNGTLRSVDWVFTSFVLASFVVHFGVVTFLENADSPVSTLSDVSPAIARLVFDPIAPPPPSSDAPDVDPSTNTTPSTPTDGTVAHNDRNPRNPRNPSDHQDAPLSDADRDRLAQDAVANATALLVGASGDLPGSALDRLRQGASLTDAADVMAQVNGVQVAGRDDAFRPRAGDTTHISGDLRNLQRTGGPVGPLVEGRPGGPTEVVIRVRVRPIDDDYVCDGCGDDVRFDDRQVQRAIRSRLRAIQACYEHRLNLNPTLNGKVAIEFRVEEVGSVSHVRITDNTTGDSGMDECVAAPLRSLRFNPGPTGGFVTVAYPFVFARQE